MHRSTFRRVELVEATRDRWRAWVWPRGRDDSARILIELALDRSCRRWITTTLEGAGAGTEIWTHAFAAGERRTDVVVDFFVPGATPANAAVLGESYVALYRRLYDEDESMMVERQRQLDVGRERRALPSDESIRLGKLDDLRPRLPLTVEFGARRFRIVESRGELLAHSTVCPHALGPLGDGEVRDGIVQCPWHGYRFDLRTLQCVSGANCRLGVPPVVSVDPGTLEVVVEPARLDAS